jgi:hypothetical protein
MRVGDMVRVKLSQSLRGGHSRTGIITALKGHSSFSNDVEVFWVLINGQLSTYGGYQLMKVAQ